MMNFGLQFLNPGGWPAQARYLFKYGLVGLFMLVGLVSAFAQPEITVRFANPQFDCATGEYCVDVEFQSDTPGEQLFGMNVRFFYDDDILEFVDFRDFANGYGPVSPNPPIVNTGNASSGSDLFGYTGPAEFINGAVQLVDQNTPPIDISTSGWTKLYQACFTVDDPNADLDSFCPSLTWDLEVDPADGGFLVGDEGVVITVVNPDPNLDSAPSNEQVVQYNWEYSGPGTAPYGMPNETTCIEIRCVDLSLDKVVDNATPMLGDNVTFTITVDNVGPDDATLVEVTDQLPSGFAYVSDDGGGSYDSGTGIWMVGTIAPAGSASLNIVATALSGASNYTNLAEVTMANGIDDDSTPDNGVDTDGDGLVEDDPDDEDDGDGVVVSPLSNPSIQLYKTVSSVSGSGGVGDMITYAFEVTNTGDVTLSNVTVTDPLVTVSGGPIASLAPGASNTTTFTATYMITQADVDAGYVENTATVDAEDPDNNPVTDISDAGDDTVETPDGEGNTNNDPTDDPTVEVLSQNPDIAIIKDGIFQDENGDGIAQVGETISYDFTVTNTGDVTLTNVMVTDPLVTVSGGPISTLAPGASNSSTFTASYTVTQADIDAGSVTNQATATGTDPNGDPVTDVSDDDSNLEDEPTVTPTPQDPAIAIIKTGAFQDENNDGFAQVGETISYNFTVTNVGNVTLTNVTVTDPLVTVSGGPIASLAVGASNSTTFTASYTLMQSDINNGSVENQATATGTDPNGDPVTDVSDDDSNLEDEPTVTPTPQDPAIAIIKTGTFNDGNNDGFAQVGETISYAFTVTNVGNVTLTNVTVTDPLVTVSGGPIASLAPGASNSTTFTASYTITQADINNGSVENQATATGDDPNGDPVTDVSDDDSNLEDEPTVTPTPQDPAIAIIKEGTFEDENGDGFAQAGETISYNFSVTNVGNVTLTNVTVTDPLVTVSGGPLAALAPGASNTTTFTATYTITQADINDGSVENQATATGTDPNGDPTTDVSDDDSNLEDEPTVTSLPQDPAIAIIKEGTFEDENGDGIAQAGETISYAFTVTNVGNVTLTNVTVTDPLVTVSGGPIASLAVGASNSTTFTATYTITQADINSGNVENQATATGTDPNNMDVMDVSDDNSNLEDDPTITVLPLDPAIAIIKNGTFQDENGDNMAQVGETISYTFSVTNVGNVTLTNVTVTDPLVTVSGGPLASLAPGASNTTSFTASYAITQADINNGGVTNQATATGTDPNNMDVTDVSDDNSDLEDDPTVTVLPQDPAIAIIKTGTFEDENGDGFAQVGETISYDFSVTNTGNVTLTNVTVTDPLVTVSGGPLVALAPGASNTTTFTATYTITQADIDNGGVENQATATGDDPNGDPVTDVSDDDSNLEDEPTVTPTPQDPAIAIIKEGTFEDENGDGIAQAGETISYDFTVTNVGNVTLTNVTVTDPLVTVSGGPIGTLAVGASNSTTFTATYMITQADINDGSVENQATATGDDPNGDPVTDVSDDNSNLEDDPTITVLPLDPAIAIIKMGTFQDENGDGMSQVGETISYTFSVTNVGNVTLTNVTVTDPLVTVSGGPLASLAPGASNTTTFTASYTITQADIDNGGVENQATATGDDPDGNPVTDISDDNSNLEDDPTDTPLPQDPAIAIIKTGTFNDENGDGFAQVGETISYAFTVTNTGNVTLTDVTVTDPLVTVSGGPIGTLAVGASNSTTFTASYTITQADINNGGVENQATATGDDPNGDPVTDVSDDDSNLEDEPTVTPTPQDPAIAIIKTGTFNDENGDGFAQVGETISYNFSVTNVGNVTLTNVTVTDPLVTVSGGPLAALAPGASNSTTFSASYTITQADIDDGSVENQATATGDDPNGDPVTDVSDDNSNLEDDPTVTVTPQDPAIAIIKTGTFNDENGDNVAQVGETISYNFSVTNVGNVTLTNITVTDPLVSVSGGPLATLAPGASNTTTFTASYVVTQTDIDNGSVENQATATGTDPNGDPTTDVSDDDSNLEDDPTDTPLFVNPDIAIIKTGTFQDENGDGFAQVGETISYAFTVTNTGNVTLTDVTVTDPLVAVSGGPIASFPPGASNSTTFTASYAITQADINDGGVENQATATGTDPNGDPVTDLSDDNSNLQDEPTVTPTPQDPAIAIIKTGTFNDENGDGFAQVGETISYNFSVTNVGNVTLTNITVTDPLVTVSGGPLAALAPGASNTTTFTASYIITQADINDGGVENQATATGTDPNGDPTSDVSDDDSNLEDEPTVTTTPQNPAIAIIKTGTFNDGNGDGIAQVGETISYNFSVTNVGNVTLTNITVTDPLVTVSGGPLASLLPGESNTTTFTASYMITQADINNGSVENQATATGIDPNGDPTTDVSDDDSNLEDEPTVTPTPQDPAIAIIKEGTFEDENGDGIAQVGETISYDFTVTNVGNVTLTNITVTDPLVTVTGGPLVSLAPGSSNSTTFMASYTLTQADINNGSVENQATATGTDPNGDPTTDVSDDDSNLEDEPTITPLPFDPGIAIIKTGTFQDENGDGFAQVGETIDYAFEVINTGNVTLTNITVTDPLVAVSGGPLASLLPGASNSTTFTASYTVTQADLDAGSVSNQATATGTDPNGDPTTDVSDDDSPLEDETTIIVLNVPAIVSGHLYTDTNGNGMQDAGEPDLANVDVIITDSNGDMQIVTTDANGDYAVFVVGGTTIVDINNNDPDYPAGSTQTEGDDPTTVTAVVGMDTDAGNDGFYFPATLTGNVYEDLNGNGTQDAGEPGLADLDIVITDSNGDMQTVTTDANGDWTASVPPGTTVVDIDDNDPDFPTPSTQTEGDDPTTVTAVGNTTTSGGVDGFQPCLTIEAFVYLEGSAFIEGSDPVAYTVPMRSSLNDLQTLPGQSYEDGFFGTVYNPAGQPYNEAPWNYAGNEGLGFDSGGDTNIGDAGYPATVTDWVLVSLRETPSSTGTPLCQAAALLHSDGTIEFVDQLNCCNVDLSQSYYLVIEHRNHLIVMSHEPVDIVNRTLTYDFRVQESYIDDPSGFGSFVGQKEILPGVFAMFAGNGNQTEGAQSDTDITLTDRTYWESQNGSFGDYSKGDYNMNGDTNVDDRSLWEENNGKFTSVPRD